MKRMTTTVSSKRQITLPAELCRELGIKPGQKLDLVMAGPAVVLTKAAMSTDEFEARLDAASDAAPYPDGMHEYIRRIRAGEDLADAD